MSESLVFVMNLVALFCIACILRLFVIPVLCNCTAGYSRIGRISVVYSCFLIFVGAFLNL